VGEFGPFDFGRPDGSTLAGGFELQRPISQSAGWVHVRNYRLTSVEREARLPGANVPGFPAIGGILNGDIAVGGNPVPTKLNPLGAKGAGEAGTVGALPAVMNAILDALAPLGVRALDMPATSERVWQGIQAAGGSSPRGRAMER